MKEIYTEKEGKEILRVLEWMRDNGIYSVDDIIDEFKCHIGIRPMPYENYIKSQRWRDLRSLVLRRDGRQCRICGKTGGLMNVHHTSYDNGILEKGDNLVVLCPECHAKIHEICKQMEMFYSELYDKTRRETAEKMASFINEQYPDGITGRNKTEAIKVFRATIEGLLSHRGSIFEVRPDHHTIAHLVLKEKAIKPMRPRRKPKICSALSMAEIMREQAQ